MKIQSDIRLLLSVIPGAFPVIKVPTIELNATGISVS